MFSLRHISLVGVKFYRPCCLRARVNDFIPRQPVTILCYLFLAKCRNYIVRKKLRAIGKKTTINLSIPSGIAAHLPPILRVFVSSTLAKKKNIPSRRTNKSKRNPTNRRYLFIVQPNRSASREPTIQYYVVAS